MVLHIRGRIFDPLIDLRSCWPAFFELSFDPLLLLQSLLFLHPLLVLPLLLLLPLAFHLNSMGFLLFYLKLFLFFNVLEA